jgi:hypothetical protein
MGMEVLGMLDFADREEPTPTTDWRRMLTEWLVYQRYQFQRKLRDLRAGGLVAWSVPPLELSVLGLVRHMTQMEHVYLAWGLGGGDQSLAYGDDDYAGGSVETVATDVQREPTAHETAISGRILPGSEDTRLASGGSSPSVSPEPAACCHVRKLELARERRQVHADDVPDHLLCWVVASSARWCVQGSRSCSIPAAA